jgi:hypothetical protein
MGLSGAVGSGAETPVARDDELDPGDTKGHDEALRGCALSSCPRTPTL